MRIPAELVGGDHDGLELEAAEGAADLIVPSAFWHGPDGVVTGASVLVYEDMGRCSACRWRGSGPPPATVLMAARAEPAGRVVAEGRRIFRRR